MPDVRRTHSQTVPPAERHWKDSVVVTFSFHCNLACTFCMVEDVLGGRFVGVDLAAFEEICRNPGERLRGVRRVVLSGGEVTVSKDLPRYAALARSIPGVEHVRIQTNATRLADVAYARSLVAAGIDEFFVSVHGADAVTCDAITRVNGSFEKILAGLAGIREAGGVLITNTAMVRANYAQLAAIVERVAPFGPRSIELWNYWPRVDEAADEFLVPVGELRPHVVDAMRTSLRHGIAPVVKWFPRCLLPEDLIPHHDDGQAKLLIEESFWEREPTYSCIYRGVCADGREACSGLSDAYIGRYGWEQERLVPKRDPSGRHPRSLLDDPLMRSLLADAGPRRAETAVFATWLASIDLAFGGDVAGWTLVSAARSRPSDWVKIDLRRGEEQVELLLARRGALPRTVERTASFDVGLWRASPTALRSARAVADAIARRIRARDAGGLALPEATAPATVS